MTSLSGDRTTRAPAVAVSFAVARVRARPSRGLVTGFGIALAVAALFVTAASPIIAGDSTLRRALEAIPAGERSLTVAVSVNSLTVDQLRSIDKQVRSILRVPELREPRAFIEYRALASSSGTIFRFAGMDDLGSAVTLLDGHLPSSCTPQRCETVLAAPATELDLPPNLGIVVVGRVKLTDASTLAGSFQPDPGEVLMIGDGAEAVGAVATLSLIGRSAGWVSVLDPSALHVADIDAVLTAAARATKVTSQSGVLVTLPQNEMQAARERAAAATQRVALAGAQGVVLLVAFVLLAAATERRQHLLARRLLRQRGASRVTCSVFTITEATWPGVIGLIIGIPAGIGTAIALAHRWHLGARNVVTQVIHASAWRVSLVAVGLVAATAIVMAYSSADSAANRMTRRWWRPTVVDGLGMGALAAGALAVSRGSATPATLISSGDPLLATLPVLAAVTVAWVAIRIVPWLVAGIARLLGHRAPLVRTALGEVARRPTLPLATAGFLAAATTLGVFSLGYRTTLQAGAHDEAAYTVPFDLTLTEGPALVRPSALRPPEGWQRIAPGAMTTDVLRRGGSVQSTALSNDTVTLVGVDPSSLSALRGWRSDFGPSLESLPGLIATQPMSAPMGTLIPIGATALVIDGSGDLSLTRIELVVQRRDGSWHSLPTVGPQTAATDSSAVDAVTATLDDGDAGGRLIGFRVGQLGEASDRIQHHTSEGNTSPDQFTSTVYFRAVRAISGSATNPTSAPVTVDWKALQSDGAVVTDHSPGIEIALRLQGSSALVVPSPPAQAAAIPAIVDPSTAAAAQNGLVTIEFANNSRSVVRVAGIASTFPGAPSRFAIVDRALAQTALDLLSPGLGTANETWIAVDRSVEPRVAAALAATPFDNLVVQRRAEIEHRLRSDPLSVFTLGLFGFAALIAGALAAAAVYLSTLADSAEQVPLHRALAADGVPGSSLSRMVRASAVVIVIGAVLLGTVAALMLLRLVTRIIAVTATATVPVPALLARIPWQGLMVAIAIVLVPSVLAAAVAARSARRAADSDLLREFG